MITNYEISVGAKNLCGATQQQQQEPKSTVSPFSACPCWRQAAAAVVAHTRVTAETRLNRVHGGRHRPLDYTNIFFLASCKVFVPRKVWKILKFNLKSSKFQREFWTLLTWPGGVISRDLFEDKIKGGHIATQVYQTKLKFFFDFPKCLTKDEDVEGLRENLLKMKKKTALVG